MRRAFIHIILLASLPAFFLASCNFAGKKKLNRYVSFWYRDKIPYGADVAYSNLKYIFPDAFIHINKSDPFYPDNIDDIIEDAADSSENLYPEGDSETEMGTGGTEDTGNVEGADGVEEADSTYAEDPAELKSPAQKTIHIYMLQALYPDSLEANAILDNAWRGNEVFISASYIGVAILDQLHLKQTGNLYRESGDSITLYLNDPATGAATSYKYPGFLEDNYFNKMDSSVVQVLGTNSEGKANFVKISYESGGNVYVHLSPFAFSNFFLLHKENHDYYEKAFSNLPATASYVSWDDYFRSPSRRQDFSAFSFLMKQEAFRWAIPLIIVLCGIVFFIESKRRQRRIPAIAPLHNSSVDFVNTIGRLYFQQKNHKNLAQKMIAHFLDYIRNRYQVSTSVLDDHFVRKISYKSGIPKEEWEGLVEDIREIGFYDSISEQALLALSARIEKLKKIN